MCDWAEIIEPPLFELVKQCTGFKTVTLEVEPEEATWSLDTKEDIDAWLDACPDTGLNALIHALRQGLEPALGPSTEHSLSVKGQDGTRYDIGVTFHPRDYLSGKTQAAKKYPDIQTDEVTHVLSKLTTRD